MSFVVERLVIQKKEGQKVEADNFAPQGLSALRRLSPPLAAEFAWALASARVEA